MVEREGKKHAGEIKVRCLKDTGKEFAKKHDEWLKFGDERCAPTNRLLATAVPRLAERAPLAGFACRRGMSRMGTRRL